MKYILVAIPWLRPQPVFCIEPPLDLETGQEIPLTPEQQADCTAWGEENAINERILEYVNSLSLSGDYETVISSEGPIWEKGEVKYRVSALDTQRFKHDFDTFEAFLGAQLAHIQSIAPDMAGMIQAGEIVITLTDNCPVWLEEHGFTRQTQVG